MSVEDRELEVAKTLGKLEAQVRELIHNDNNRTTRDAAADQILGGLRGLPDQISAMETRLNTRLVALEEANIARNTRDNLWAALIRSPVVVWVIMIAGGIWAALSGKIDWNG